MLPYHYILKYYKRERCDNFVEFLLFNAIIKHLYIKGNLFIFFSFIYYIRKSMHAYDDSINHGINLVTNSATVMRKCVL